MNSRILPVILCGGAGTRLWPLSRRSFPKQFVPLINDKSLLALTLERVAIWGNKALIVGSEEHRFMVTDAMQMAGVIGDILLEPIARNTAAAMALAVLHASKADQYLLLFCPADHYIPDLNIFAETVERGIPAANSGAIVTFGIVPNFPSTAYGYIQQGTPRTDGALRVECFIEKPNAAKAQDLLLNENALWNSGIFLCKASTLTNALELYAADILESCKKAISNANSELAPTGHNFIRPDRALFAESRAQSIDYAVLEHHDNVAVVPFAGRWSDVGSWNAVADLTELDIEGNKIQGQGMAHLSKGTFILAPHRPVVALGADNLIIVDTPDAVLVAHRDYVEQVKEVVDRLQKAQLEQAVTHRRVSRPWGWYDSIDSGERFHVKRIGVKAGASLSLQRHYHRAEHWVVVKGTAEVTRGNETFLLGENQSAYIPIGEIHRLRNPGMMELEIIEIQSGTFLSEDDIVRIEDNYGRN